MEKLQCNETKSFGQANDMVVLICILGSYHVKGQLKLH